MNFHFDEAINILERTPRLLISHVSGLPGAWLLCNEGEGTWTVTEVIDHLIEAERKNWIPRLETILREEGSTIPNFDRFAHLEHAADAPIDAKLIELNELRCRNLEQLRKRINPSTDLEKVGVHPSLGVVRVRELLSTWVVHDFTHVTQIFRIMSNRYREDVGPWKEYLGILQSRPSSTEVAYLNQKSP